MPRLRFRGTTAIIICMATIPEAIASAVEHHQAGRLQAAEQIYRQILAVDPNQPDAIHLLGVMAHQLGKPALAVEYIGRAITLKGTDGVFHNNLGNACLDLGRLDEAIACYRCAWNWRRITPTHTTTWAMPCWPSGSQRKRLPASAARWV